MRPTSNNNVYVNQFLKMVALGLGRNYFRDLLKNFYPTVHGRVKF